MMGGRDPQLDGDTHTCMDCVAMKCSAVTRETRASAREPTNAQTFRGMPDFSIARRGKGT